MRPKVVEVNDLMSELAKMLRQVLAENISSKCVRLRQDALSMPILPTDLRELRTFEAEILLCIAETRLGLPSPAMASHPPRHPELYADSAHFGEADFSGLHAPRHDL